MAGEGAILRKAREERGWSYKDVEERIKIRPLYLQALEEEDYNTLPGKAYTKGFLRTYSKLLGLDAEMIVGYYNESLEEEKEPDVIPHLTPIQTAPVWFKPVVLIVTAIIAIAVVVGITYYSKIGENPRGSDYTPTPVPSAPQADEPSSEGDPAQGNNTDGDATSDNEQPAAPQYQGLVAEILFTEDCWLHVNVDGNTVIQGMRAAGTKETLKAESKIEFVTIGNAGGLDITLNGKEVPPLGGRKEVVENYIMTRHTVDTL